MTAAPRPGWYPDPAGTADEATRRYRWWTGVGWASDTSDSSYSPAPSSRAVGASRVRAVLVLTLGLTLFVGASVSVGLMLWRDPTPTARSPVASRVGGTPPEGSGQLDLHTRVASIGAASLVLPGDPYELSPDPSRIPGLFDVLFMANAGVHRRYDGSHTWSATVMLVRLSPAVSGGDLEERGTKALRRLSRAFFASHPTKLSDVRSSDRTVSSCTGVLMTGRVNYAVDRLPSRFDTVTAQVVELGDGSVVMAVTSVPDDTAPEVVAQAAAALSSLRIG